MLYIHSRILHSHKKECIWVSCNEIDEPWAYHTEGSPTERWKQIPYIKAYIWNLELWYWWTYFQCSSGDTGIENRLVDPGGEREGVMNRESDKVALMLIHYNM